MKSFDRTRHRQNHLWLENAVVIFDDHCTPSRSVSSHLGRSGQWGTSFHLFYTQEDVRNMESKWFRELDELIHLASQRHDFQTGVDTLKGVKTGSDLTEVLPSKL